MLGAIIIWFYYGIPMAGICIAMLSIPMSSDIGGAIARLCLTALLFAISLAIGGDSLRISSDCMLSY